MPTDDPYGQLLDALGEALQESGELRSTFGQQLGWKGDAMVRGVLKGTRNTSLRTIVRWAAKCGRRLELVKPGDPVSRVVQAIRADTELPSRDRRALEASYLAARRHFVEAPPRQRRRAAASSE